MTPEEFRHFLFSGHGRALVYLQDHGSAGLEEIIFHALVHETLYRYGEDYRDDFFVDVLRISGLEEELLPRLVQYHLETDPKSEEGYPSYQRQLVIAWYAARGNAAARKACDTISPMKVEEKAGAKDTELSAPSVSLSPASRATDYAAFKERILSGESARAYYWVRTATPADLTAAAADLLATDDPLLLGELLLVFGEAKFPADPLALLRFIELPEVAGAAVAALAPFQHERLRQVAVEKLTAAQPFHRAVQLLVENFHSGDDALIEALLRETDDDEDIHTLGISTLDILERHPGNWDEVLRLIYEKTPCGECRWVAVKELAKRRLLTSKILRECKLDRFDLVPFVAEKYEAGEEIR